MHDQIPKEMKIEENKFKKVKRNFESEDKR